LRLPGAFIGCNYAVCDGYSGQFGAVQVTTC